MRECTHSLIGVRRIIARHHLEYCLFDIRHRLTEEEQRQPLLRGLLARNPETATDLLQYLACDTNALVRHFVRCNASSSTRTQELAASHSGNFYVGEDEALRLITAGVRNLSVDQIFALMRIPLLVPGHASASWPKFIKALPQGEQIPEDIWKSILSHHEVICYALAQRPDLIPEYEMWIALLDRLSPQMWHQIKALPGIPDEVQAYIVLAGPPKPTVPNWGPHYVWTSGASIFNSPPNGWSTCP